VTCDFCNRPYQYDAAAVEALFGEPARGSGHALH
jgi:hypothetical protein